MGALRGAFLTVYDIGRVHVLQRQEKLKRQIFHHGKRHWSDGSVLDEELIGSRATVLEHKVYVERGCDVGSCRGGLGQEAIPHRHQIELLVAIDLIFWNTRRKTAVPPALLQRTRACSGMRACVRVRVSYGRVL
jgi:hypothetical protein